MKNLILLIAFIVFSLSAKSQIKIWPGGSTSIGTTANSPSGSNRTLFFGPVNIKPSNTNQSLRIFNIINT